MDYYLLNIKVNDKSEVDYWIKERHIAPIFYGNVTIEQIHNNNTKLGRAQPIAKSFVDTFSELNKNALIFSIGESNIYFYKQDGALSEIELYSDKESGNGMVKGFKIKIVKEVDVKDCPLVLVTIKANRQMSSGAFKELSGKEYDGDISAIEYILKGTKPSITSYDKYLRCLSSLEFETLIAKMFEEKGYFVPAYKGGFIKNFDLFCKKADQAVSIQLKLTLKKEDYKKFTDYFYCITSDIEKENIKTWKDIQTELKKCPNTKKWLQKTLEWVHYSGE
jgi:hypothetical protein